MTNHISPISLAALHSVVLLGKSLIILLFVTFCVFLMDFPIPPVVPAFREVQGIPIYYPTLTQDMQKVKQISALGIDTFETLYNLGNAFTTASAIGHALWCVNTCLNF